VRRRDAAAPVLRLHWPSRGAIYSSEHRHDILYPAATLLRERTGTSAASEPLPPPANGAGVFAVHFHDVVPGGPARNRGYGHHSHSRWS